MESTRQKKVSRLLQKELAIIFQKQAPTLLGNVIVSVSIVRISPDLGNANVFISIFPVKDPHDALEKIQKSCTMIRKNLAARVRNQLRIIPELQFYLDDSAAYAEEIDRLLKQ